MRNWLLSAAAVGIVLAGAAQAETPTQQTALTLERVFESPDLAGPRPRLPKLSPDGRLATVLRARADDLQRFDLWAIDTATGQSRMLVDSAKFAGDGELSEAEKMRRERARIAGARGIVEYDWAPDSRHLLVPVDGDLFLAATDGSVRRLTQTAKTETDAEMSPKGHYVSFVRDQNLHIIDLKTGQSRALTTDGAGALSWGVAEFVAQEEMGRSDGYWWSPDDSRIAVARVDESQVQIVPRAAIGAAGTKVYEQRYPKAGTPNAKVELWLMDADGGRRVKADLGPDSDIYLARVDWLPDGRALLVQRQSRDQKRVDVLRIDTRTGAATLLFSETSQTWVNLHDNLKPLKDGSLLWTSERDGYSHIYRWADGRMTQLTRGPWVVDKIVGVDERAGRIFFTGFTSGGAFEHHLYSIGLRQSGEPRRLTPEVGWHDAVMDGTATRALITSQTPRQPSQSWLADANGKRLAWMMENRVDASHPYAPYLAAHVDPRFGLLKAADGTDLPYRLLVPRGLKPGERRPVFVDVYGGPGAQRVSKAFVSPLHQYLVQQGWIVFTLDNRGAANRGKAFEEVLYRQMGKTEVEDQLRGLEWLKAQNFVDPERVVVSGWSYGGYMVLRLLAAAPGAYAAGVAGAPVTDWGLYDTHYTERYLGNPAIDKAPYERSNVLPVADRISDPLLLIHGMADDNVVFENSTALMAKLQQARRPFDVMVYPGQTHALSDVGTRIHNWSTILRFLNRSIAKPQS